MLRRGLSTRQVAEMLDSKYITVYYWLRDGRTPRRTDSVPLEKLTSLLEMSFTELNEIMNSPEIRHRSYAERDGMNLTGMWRGIKEPMDAICPRGHLCQPTPNNIDQGNDWCRKCLIFKDASTDRFPQFMCELMSGRDVTASDIAADLGVGVGQIGRWLRGQNLPSADTLEKIIVLLEAPEELLREVWREARLAQDNSALKERLAQDFFYDFAASVGAQILENYKGYDVPISTICPKGHPCSTRPHNVIQAKRWICPECGLEKISARDRRGISGFRGVIYNKDKNVQSRWRALASFKGISVWAGSFSTAEEAAHARDAKMRSLDAPESRMNFPKN